MEDHVALHRNLGLGWDILLLRLIPGWDILLLRLIPGGQTLRFPNACVTSREAVCTNYMMVFGMTQPGLEPTIYRMRGGH